MADEEGTAPEIYEDEDFVLDTTSEESDDWIRSPEVNGGQGDNELFGPKKEDHAPESPDNPPA